MASDRMDTKAWRDLNAQLNRIALAGERIADALEKYVENDPLAAVTKALEVETREGSGLTCDNCGAHIPSEDYPCCMKCGHYRIEQPHEQQAEYGSDLPKSERWRLGRE